MEGWVIHSVSSLTLDSSWRRKQATSYYTIISDGLLFSLWCKTNNNNKKGAPPPPHTHTHSTNTHTHTTSPNSFTWLLRCFATLLGANVFVQRLPVIKLVRLEGAAQGRLVYLFSAHQSRQPCAKLTHARTQCETEREASDLSQFWFNNHKWPTHFYNHHCHQCVDNMGRKLSLFLMEHDVHASFVRTRHLLVSAAHAAVHLSSPVAKLHTCNYSVFVLLAQKSVWWVTRAKNMLFFLLYIQR